MAFEKKQIKRLKNWFKVFFATNSLYSRRRQLFFSGCFLSLALMTYLAISLLNVSRSEVALARLNESFEKQEICHEECYLWRQSQEKIVVIDLKKNSKKITERLVDYWLTASESNLAFKKELIKIMWLAYGTNNPPDYLNDYLAQSDSNPDLVREIVSVFSLGSSGNRQLGELLSDKVNSATSTEEKISALKALREFNNVAEIDNYFILLNSNEEVLVKREALKNISAIREKSAFFTLEQLTIIKSLILALETETHLRQDLVFLLGDYYLVYPAASIKIWREICQNKSLDNISRLFSADNLNHLAGATLELPEVSPTEWADYYNK